MIKAVKNTFRSPYWFIRNWRYQIARFEALILNWRANSYYNCLSVAELQASRKSETLFVFGSGYSLNDITDAEWKYISQCDTLGFNWFCHQNFIRMDYHIIRETGGPTFGYDQWYPYTKKYITLFNQNSHYKNTILLVQEGWLAIGANRVMGLKLLDPSFRIYRFRNKKGTNARSLPSGSFQDGFVHFSGTLSDAVNFGYLNGWKKIVLVGVDLYDRRYFWLDSDQMREIEEEYYLEFQQNGTSQRKAVYKKVEVETPHYTISNGIIDFMGYWRDYLEKQGVQLYIYNPKSLLAQIMPIYEY